MFFYNTTILSCFSIPERRCGSGVFELMVIITANYLFRNMGSHSCNSGMAIQSGVVDICKIKVSPDLIREKQN